MTPFIASNVYRIIEVVRSEPISKYLKENSHIPYLSRNEIEKIQLKKLENIIKHSYHNIPFYRKLFRKCGLNIKNLSLPDDIKRLPFLTKSELQRNYENMCDPLVKPKISIDHTSGSTGKPLIVFKDRDRSAFIRATMYRFYNMYGINIGDKQARFWGVPLIKSKELKEHLKDIVGNRIRLNAFQFNNENLNNFVKKQRKFKPKYFYGYPSLIYNFAKWIRQHDLEEKELKNLNLSCIITTGEILYDFQRKMIEETFDCKVANEYGASEVGIIAFECQYGNLHINSDHIFLEVINNKSYGEIVITELNNFYNPLIRYKIKDFGSIKIINCKCGINFPVLDELYGREVDFIISPDNNYIYASVLTYNFRLKRGVKDFQAIQNKKDLLLIKIVPDDNFDDDVLIFFRKKLTEALGDKIKIEFLKVEKIIPDKSGKLRYFISNISLNKDKS